MLSQPRSSRVSMSINFAGKEKKKNWRQAARVTSGSKRTNLILIRNSAADFLLFSCGVVSPYRRWGEPGLGTGIKKKELFYFKKKRNSGFGAWGS